MGVWGWKAVARNPGLLRSAQYSPGQPSHQRTAEGNTEKHEQTHIAGLYADSRDV